MPREGFPSNSHCHFHIFPPLQNYCFKTILQCNCAISPAFSLSRYICYQRWKWFWSLSCPDKVCRQFNRWQCHWLTQNTQRDPNNCALWDNCSKWWENMAWQKKDIEKNKDKDKDKDLRLVTFERFVHTDEETNAILGMFICSKRASFLTSQKVSSIPFGKFAQNFFFIFPLITLSLARSLSGFLPPSAPQRLL